MQGMLAAACTGRTAAGRMFRAVWGEQRVWRPTKGVGSPPKGQVYVGRHSPALPAPAPPPRAPPRSACLEPIWGASAAAKAIGLMQASLPAPRTPCPSPAQPRGSLADKRAAGIFHAVLGARFSLQIQISSRLRPRWAQHTSDTWEHQQHWGPLGKGKPCHRTEVPAGAARPEQAPGRCLELRVLVQPASFPTAQQHPAFSRASVPPLQCFWEGSFSRPALGDPSAPTDSPQLGRGLQRPHSRQDQSPGSGRAEGE